ncbi:hypothetical protein LK09_02230 [Microbacterium mangrovi]|uniref:Uncharacterized protein n=1 Tax=Microbacterium mangrovi TaxID=1348253 RepID=A0A0B2A8Q1_9MICO|nr:hypothetical protein [Microbacterium mangrovi]KHK99480.1 hypothetical protein LK09_02230 [Microbacterium mangrovi]
MGARPILLTLGAAFTIYLTVRGELWTTPPLHPGGLLVSDLLYAVTSMLCLFVGVRGDDRDSTDRRGRPRTQGVARLPLWVTILAFVVAIVQPLVTTWAVGAALATSVVGTAYIGQIGALMTILMARRRPLWAWAGTAALVVLSSASLGFLTALGSGLVGSLMWVAAAQLLLWSMDRAVRDTVRLAELQRTAIALRADQEGRQRQRRVQVQRALEVAGPVLTRTIETRGALSTAERAEALRAEARLRDELRAPRLLDDHVRAALDSARRRGIQVTLLDEGGLEGVDADALSRIRRSLAVIIAGADSDRLYIRTSPDPHVAVTVVGRSAAGMLSDEDNVDLWHEIRHDTESAQNEN